MNEKRKIRIFDSHHLINDYLFDRWVEIAEISIERRGRFTAALSGGRSPIEFYHKLSEINTSELWLKTHVFLTDERFVPLTHQDSNYRLIHDYLLDRSTIPPENIHHIKANLPTVELAAEDYKDKLVQFFDMNHSGAPVFDFMLLGMGPDGHTASLFPEMQDFNVPGRLTIPASLNRLEHERISLTLPVINGARYTFMFAFGASKADIVKAILEDDFDCPAAQVLPEEGEVIYLLDQESAKKLGNATREEARLKQEAEETADWDKN